MRKIAIVRRNGLGDLLCAFPLILYFRRYFPSDHLTLFVDQRNAPLLPYLPSVDQIVVFRSKGWKYWNLVRQAFYHRLKGYDLAISAKTSPMKLMNAFLFALGAKKRIAYVDDSWHSCLINVPLRFDGKRAKLLHQALKGLHLIDRHLECVPEELYPKISIPSDIRARYSLARSNDSPILLLSATTTRATSRLEPKRYAELVNRLYKKCSFSIVVVGQEQDKKRALEIAEFLKPPHEIHFPRNFETFMVLLDLCDLYFVGDGGIAHIGAALDKESVILYGETNPIEWHPLSRKATCFYHPKHVDYLSDNEIYPILEQKLEALCAARPNL